MKRSKKIHLVLITAALASCNRVVIPSQSATAYITDSTLTQTPDEEDPSQCVCTVNANDSSTISLYDEPYSFYYNGSFYGPVYTPGRIYRRGAFWRSHRFVVRGGFGKSSSAVAS